MEGGQVRPYSRPSQGDRRRFLGAQDQAQSCRASQFDAPALPRQVAA